jgi:hypothetical protein
MLMKKNEVFIKSNICVRYKKFKLTDECHFKSAMVVDKHRDRSKT